MARAALSKSHEADTLTTQCMQLESGRGNRHHVATYLRCRRNGGVNPEERQHGQRHMVG